MFCILAAYACASSAQRASIEVVVDGGSHALDFGAGANLRHVVSRFVRDHDLRPAAEVHATLLERLRAAREAASVPDWSPSAFWRGTGGVYVVWASNYTSGGPACLHALHNAANAGGAMSYMYTLNARYATAHSVGLDHFVPEMLSAADIVVVPESWWSSISAAQLDAFRARGTRWFAYTLAAAQAGGTLPFRRRETFQRGVAGALVLGHYIREYFDLPVAASLVLEAPLESAFDEAAKRYAAARAAGRAQPKEDLVVVDSDFGLSGANGIDVMTRVRDALLAEGVDVAVPRKMSVAALIALYERAKCVLDLYLPGPERLTNEGEFSFIYRYILRESRSQFDSLPLTYFDAHLANEGVLFDAYPVVTLRGNGGNLLDKPFEGRFRVEPHDAKAIVAAVLDVVRNHAALGAHFARFKRSVRAMPRRYAERVPAVLRSARYVFSVDARTRGAELALGRVLLSVLHHLPLASLDVRVADRASFLRQWSPLLEQLEERGFADAATGGAPWHSVRFRDTAVEEEGAESEQRGSWRGSRRGSQHGPLRVQLELPLVLTGRQWLEALVDAMLARRATRASVCTASGVVLARAELDVRALPRRSSDVTAAGGAADGAAGAGDAECAVVADATQLWRPGVDHASHLCALCRSTQLWRMWEARVASARGVEVDDCARAC
jgi:hypothetical protein